MVVNIEDFISSIGFVSGIVPERVQVWPGMISKDERRLLYAIGSCYYSGSGVLVDAGAFLGAATCALATGIKDNFRFQSSELPSKVIQCYELGLWDSEGFDKYVDKGSDLFQSALSTKRYTDRESFAPLLRTLLEEYSELVDLRLGDIAKLITADRPVELVFYDCLNTYESDYAVFKALAGNFVPGRTLVIQQDYFYEGAIDAKLRQEYFSNYFKYLGSVQTTAVFRYQKAIPSEDISSDPLIGLDYVEKVKLLEGVVTRVEPSAFNIYAQLAVVALMLREEKYADANIRLKEIERQIADSRSTPRTYDIVSGYRRLITGKS
jgi:hypothetical protein